MLSEYVGHVGLWWLVTEMPVSWATNQQRGYRYGHRVPNTGKKTGVLIHATVLRGVEPSRTIKKQGS